MYFNGYQLPDGETQLKKMETLRVCAFAWLKMQHRLFKGTPDLLPHVTGRIYAYIGLTLYESIVPGMPGHQSIASQLNGELKLPGSRRASITIGRPAPMLR
jgi:hypothetical protein